MINIAEIVSLEAEVFFLDSSSPLAPPAPPLLYLVHSLLLELYSQSLSSSQAALYPSNTVQSLVYAGDSELHILFL